MWTQLAATVLTWMVQLQPPNHEWIGPELAASYPDTAEEIATAAEESPLPGDNGRYTAAVLTVMAFRESSFRRDVVGDDGASRGLFQISTIWGEPSARLALKLLHKSFNVCREKPLEDRLGWYMWGASGCEHRLELSRSRMHTAARLAKASN
jgi:hypothetical protein